MFDQVRDIEIDAIYFNTDDLGNSFPAVFFKKVQSFDETSLQQIAEAHRKTWNYKRVLFLYVYSDTEVRIYNCSEKPVVITDQDVDYDRRLKEIELGVYLFSDNDQLKELNTLFSRIAIDTGIVWTLESAHAVREKLNLRRRVDKYLVQSLVNTAHELKQKGLEVDFIHKIMLRSLFLLYLEDRKATDEKFYSKIKKGAKSYFDILEDVRSTYELYGKLEEHFNGNIFTVEPGEKISIEQLQLIKKCFISGNDGTSQTSLFAGWRLFDFSIIQIELLSEIYENFLFETAPEIKKKTGTYYTPPSLVEFILNEKLPIGQKEKNYNVKILDPACGSGIFLVESFKRLVKRYESHHKIKLTDFGKLKKLLTENIFGIELHEQAIKVAAFSLYLALVDNLDPKTLWKDRRLPNLINNPADASLKAQGKNLFCRDTLLKGKDIETIKFDLIVGNPPFGTSNLSDSVRTYCEAHGFAKEQVLPFLHKATQLSPTGDIALICNTKILTNTGTSYKNFREWLFNECYVEKVFNFSILRNAKKWFGGQLFGDATGPISILIFRREVPLKPSDKIAYYAPKTYIKSNVIEGLSIDSTDLKFLPRDECRKPDSKIWKVAMWGNGTDIELIDRLLGLNNVEAFLDTHEIDHEVGLQPLHKATIEPIVDNNIPNLDFIEPDKIERFYTDKSNFSGINALLRDPQTIGRYLEFYHVQNKEDLPPINVFKRTTGKDLFKGPLLLSKEGFKKNKLCFSYVDESVAYNSTVLGFRSGDSDQLRFLSSVLNSELATYFLLLISSSWGIERERIKPNEVYAFPIVERKNIYDKLVERHKAIEELIKNSVLQADYSALENDINKLVYDLYAIDPGEKQSIKDFLDFSVDLFHRQEGSPALHSALPQQTIEYGKIISSELNDFLEGQGLFTHATVYNINRFTPLMMIKLSFGKKKKKEVSISDEPIDSELNKLDKHLWEAKSKNIYFRKKLNYKTGDDVYIVRPNQRRFWSKSMALEDASGLILEILNGIE